MSTPLPSNPSSFSALNRRSFLYGVAATALAGCTRTSASGAAEPKRKMNILFVTSDDMGLQLGCYGDPLARTPNLDALAAQGTRFKTTWVSQSSCSPSRSSILTGLFPHQNGQLGLSHMAPPYSMKSGIPNLAKLLKKAGYFNGIMGKLHVEPKNEFPFDFGSVEYWGDSRKTQDVKYDLQRATEFVEKAGDKPFFLYLNFHDPHEPFVKQVEGVPEPPFTAADIKQPLDFSLLDTPELRQNVADYYNGCTRVDIAMGLILKMLDEKGLSDNTVVVFFGDNGPPFPGGKVTCYEAGMAVPLIIRWPGQPANQVSEALVSGVDLFPTILQAAGVTPPANAGQSLVPLLGGKTENWRQTLCGEFNAHQRRHFYPQRTIRDERYHLIVSLLAGEETPWMRESVMPDAEKFISPQAQAAWKMRLERPPIELYDLQTDPKEMNNLAGQPQMKEVQERLTKELEAWRRETDDPFLDAAKLAEQVELHTKIAKMPPAKGEGE